VRHESCTEPRRKQRNPGPRLLGSSGSHSSRKQGVCYFVSIGARAPGHLLAQVFDEWADLDVSVSPANAAIARAFPIEDEVRLVTRRGCSCDLVGANERTTKTVAAFRSSLVRVVEQFGSVRLLVRRQLEPCRLPASPARVAFTVHDFIRRKHWFLEDVVLDISGREPPSQLART
jgi:hypothetical protein